MTKVVNFSDNSKSGTNNQSAVIELPVRNSHGIPVFADFLQEIQRRIDVEIDLKNAAFMFLVSKGLYREFHNQLHANKFRTDFQGRSNIAYSYLMQESEVCNA